MINKIFKTLFSPMLMGVLFIIMAVALAIATFIENDYGAPAARNMVYDAWWFEVLFLLFIINIAGQIVVFRLYRREKLTIFLFHAAFIVIIIGAAITRFTGFEGMMHIREGEDKSFYISSDNYIGLRVADQSESLLIDESDKFSITSVSVDKYQRKLNSSGIDGSVRLVRFIPNASETVVETPSGKPVISMLVTRGMTAREVVFLSPGEVRNIAGFTIGFGVDAGCDINITMENGSFLVSSAMDINSMSMGSRESALFEAGESIPLQVMQIYSIESTRFIPQVITASGTVRPSAMDMSNQSTGQNAMEFEILTGNSVHTLYLWSRNNGSASRSSLNLGDKTVTLSYGPREVTLPFSIKLNEFILERYPGSNSPSGYKSDVVLTDSEHGIEKPYLIFMNNILKHRGYRFFQSSYDNDEKGTVLSVNYDLPGMLVTYTGYGMMILFIVLTLFNRFSHFYKVTGSYWTSSLRKVVTIIVLVIAGSFLMPANGQRLVVNKKIADDFGKVLVQDQKGRTKPSVYTQQ
jgi:hypothetical protein